VATSVGFRDDYKKSSPPTYPSSLFPMDSDSVLLTIDLRLRPSFWSDGQKVASCIQLIREVATSIYQQHSFPKNLELSTLYVQELTGESGSIDSSRVEFLTKFPPLAKCKMIPQFVDSIDELLTVKAPEKDLSNLKRLKKHCLEHHSKLSLRTQYKAFRVFLKRRTVYLLGETLYGILSNGLPAYSPRTVKNPEGEVIKDLFSTGPLSLFPSWISCIVAQMVALKMSERPPLKGIIHYWQTFAEIEIIPPSPKQKPLEPDEKELDSEELLTLPFTPIPKQEELEPSQLKEIVDEAETFFAKMGPGLETEWDPVIKRDFDSRKFLIVRKQLRTGESRIFIFDSSKLLKEKIEEGNTCTIRPIEDLRENESLVVKLFSEKNGQNTTITDAEIFEERNLLQRVYGQKRRKTSIAAFTVTNEHGEFRGLLLPRYTMDLHTYVYDRELAETDQEKIAICTQLLNKVNLLISTHFLFSTDFRVQNFLVKMKDILKLDPHDFGDAQLLPPLFSKRGPVPPFKARLGTTYGPYTTFADLNNYSTNRKKEKSITTLRERVELYEDVRITREKHAVFMMGMTIFSIFSEGMSAYVYEAGSTSECIPATAKLSKNRSNSLPDTLRRVIFNMIRQEPEKRPFMQQAFTQWKQALIKS